MAASVNLVKALIRRRLWLILHYVVLYVYIAVVYGGALITEYGLLHLVEWILRADIEKFEVVKTWFERAKIGLAFLVMIGALVHALISTVQQIGWDIRHADDSLE